MNPNKVKRFRSDSKKKEKTKKMEDLDKRDIKKAKRKRGIDTKKTVGETQVTQNCQTYRYIRYALVPNFFSI